MMEALLVVLAASNVVVQSASWSAAKPGRLPIIGNEDACFCTGANAGVFDGVSSAKGSGAYARALASGVRTRLGGVVRRPSEWRAAAVDSLSSAAASASRGAATACIAGVCDETSTGTTWNTLCLGDSSALLLLPPRTADGVYSVAAITRARMHSPGCPWQLPNDSPASAELAVTRLDDPYGRQETSALLAIGLLISDGVSDNLRRAEICDVVSRHANLPPVIIAARLVEAAQRAGVVKDDTTVVCLKIKRG